MSILKTLGRRLLPVLLATSVPFSAMAEDFTISDKRDTTFTLNGGDDELTITKTGEIAVTDSYGVQVTSEGNEMINEGKVNVSGDGGYYGIYLNDDNNTLTNINEISTSGPVSHSVYINYHNNTLTNSGTIKATGDNAHAVYVSGNTNTLTNSGKIISEKGRAFHITGANNTLTLEAGSFLQGGLNVGRNATVNIKTGPGQSVVWDFAATGALNANQVKIEGTGIHAYKASSKQFASLDATNLIARSDILADRSRNVLNLAASRLELLRTVRSLNGQSESISGNGGAVAPFAKNGVWIAAFGTRSKYKEGDITLAHKSHSYGGAIGFDGLVLDSGRFGVLAGYGRGRFESESRFSPSYKNRSNDFFAALYGRQQSGQFFVDVILPVGYSRHEDKRFVNINTAENGLAEVTSSYNSWWVSPEATIGVDFAGASGFVFTPNARLRYVREWVKGYEEKGDALAVAKFGAHDVSLLEGRVGVQLAKVFGDGGLVKFGVGYQHRRPLGDNKVAVTLLEDQKIDFEAKGKVRNMGYVNVDVNLPLSEQVALSLSGEAAAASLSKDDLVLGGKAAIEFRF